MYCSLASRTISGLENPCGRADRNPLTHNHAPASPIKAPVSAAALLANKLCANAAINNMATMGIKYKSSAACMTERSSIATMTD